MKLCPTTLQLNLMTFLAFGVRFDPLWSIARRARFKAEIARKRNVNPILYRIKIIFAGQELLLE
jgi:hypothetical protein